MSKKKQRFDLLDNRVAEKLGVRVHGDKVQGLGRKMQAWVDAALDKDEVWADGHFMDDVRQATMRGAHPASTVLFYALIGIFVLFFLWANIARIDQVARGEGQVIPSGQIQAVGNPEGGVVAEIMVRTGDIVQPGQPLVRLDDSAAAGGLGEKTQRRAYLQAHILRLEALVEGKDTLVFPDDLRAEAPAIVAEAESLFRNRDRELKSSLAVLAEQVEQKRQELTDARRTAGSTAQRLRLAQEEHNLAKPAYDSGAIPRSDMVRLEMAVVEARRENSTAQLAIPSAQAALREAEAALSEGELRFKNESQDELAKMRDELNRLDAGVQADVGRVQRTLLRSPVLAEVKDVLVNTIGQAVEPNANIVELVPLEDSLLIEARLKPADIAFVRTGQEANVRLSAYDFAIYGGLKGTVENVSADSFTTKKDETYFKVRVRTEKNYLGSDANPLPIKSGMVATVDILTGKRTIMQYLLKPINRGLERALSER